MSFETGFLIIENMKYLGHKEGLKSGDPALARAYPVATWYWQKILRAQVQGERALPPRAVVSVTPSHTMCSISTASAAYFGSY